MILLSLMSIFSSPPNCILQTSFKLLLYTIDSMRHLTKWHQIVFQKVIVLFKTNVQENFMSNNAPLTPRKHIPTIIPHQRTCISEKCSAGK